ncbi:MAG: adenosylcobinamide-GDP ribazoletransferase [Methanosarcinales archaeon]|nr:adenosylcobinamide-GDP ribazoletransferase [Methanosarcinales archaeon]MCD4765347.1 adenosylcobinamide-GDP ribazoletransferase [Methanosarcinales archaeon]
MNLFDGLLGAIGFLTTLPAGKTDRFVHLQKRTYLFPVAGVLIGIILGVIATILMVLLPGQPGIFSVLMIISIYLFTGFNHLDALSDFGDGITAHGSREKKVRALKDMALGTGGVAFIVFYMLLLFVFIQSLATLEIGTRWGFGIGISLLVAEVASKHSMITTACLGQPIHQGMGSVIADNTGPWQLLVSLLISALVCTVAMGMAGLVVLVMAMLASVVVLVISNRHFGGINGDCIGTSNELARLVALGTIFTIYAGGLVAWMPW